MSAEEYRDVPARPDPRHELMESADYSQFITSIPLMVSMARYGASNEAISYRQFHVGASAYVLNFDGTKLPVAMGGANYKPNEQFQKYCAEMDIIDQAEEDGYDHIIGLVIAGTTDPEEIRAVMGRVTPTLHPCRACQDKMDKSPLVSEETIIMTVGLDEDVAQVHTFDDLQTIYEVEESDAAASLMAPPIKLDLQNWAQKERAFDAITQASADTDPATIARLVLASAVSLGD